MADFDYIPINVSAEQLENIAKKNIVTSILSEQNTNEEIPTAKSVFISINDFFINLILPKQNEQDKNIFDITESLGNAVNGVEKNSADIKEIKNWMGAVNPILSNAASTQYVDDLFNSIVNGNEVSY